MRPRQQVSLPELNVARVDQAIMTNLHKSLPVLLTTKSGCSSVLPSSPCTSGAMHSSGFGGHFHSSSKGPKMQSRAIRSDAKRTDQRCDSWHSRLQKEEFLEHLICPKARIITARPMGRSASTIHTLASPHLPISVRLKHIDISVFTCKTRMMVVCSRRHTFRRKVDLCSNRKDERYSWCGQASHPTYT